MIGIEIGDAHYVFAEAAAPKAPEYGGDGMKEATASSSEYGQFQRWNSEAVAAPCANGARLRGYSCCKNTEYAGAAMKEAAASSLEYAGDGMKEATASSSESGQFQRWNSDAVAASCANGARLRGYSYCKNTEYAGVAMKEAAASSSENGQFQCWKSEAVSVPCTNGTRLRGYSYCKNTEVIVPSLADEGSSHCAVMETVALLSCNETSNAAAFTSEGGVCYCKKIEAEKPTPVKGLSYWKFTESTAPTSDRQFYSKITESAVPTSGKLSYSKITDAAAPTLEKGVSYSLSKEAEAPTPRGNSLYQITEALVPTSEKGLFVDAITRTSSCLLENGVSHCNLKEAAAPTSERVVSYCKSTELGAHVRLLENGVSHCNLKEAAAPTSEGGVSYCKSTESGVHASEKGVFLNPITEIKASSLENGVSYQQVKDTAALPSEGGVSHCKITEVGAPTSEDGVSLNSVTETTVPALENGVSYYEKGFPDVLRPPSITDDSRVSLYAYIIHYTLLQEGQDPINITPPTQFVLLNHFLLDEEVANDFSVRLNLPHQECIAAHLTPCDMISLTLDQVNIVEVFNGVLFSIVRSRSTFDCENVYTVENKTKGYHVMPLKDGVDFRKKAKMTAGLIDWTMSFDLVHCKLNIKKWMHYHATLSINTDSCFLNDTGTFEKGWLRLKSGVYKEEDLMDAFVTYGPYNTSCFIVGISDELCGLSIMQGSDCCLSYKDFWLKRFEVELQYASQPLLIGCSLSHAGNFLQRPSEESLWCNAKAKRVIFPPEVCVLQTGLKGKLWRGAFRLPSILCGLENALLAAQLRDHIGPQISVFKIQEALTSGAYNVYQSYERLELVGDSFLTLVAATSLYMKDTSMNKIDLAISLHSLVENKHLFRCAEACGLASYVLNEPFQIKGWVPPGRIPECYNSNGKNAQVGPIRRQRISWRTLADVVEAVVGAYAIYGSMADALKAMSWLGVTIEYPQTAAGVLCSGNSIAAGNSMPQCQIADLEGRLKYSFKNRDLASMALCYLPGDCDGGLHFSRLAYLGDCILSHYVARHLITVHQSLDVGTINEMKQSVINKESLACAAVRNKLHTFITGITLSHKESILMYASALEKESTRENMLPAYGFLGLSAPKGLGDLISSIGAAIFLDCELDSELVWKILQPFLEPLPKPGSFSLHPINELTQFCKAKFLSVVVQSSFKSGVYKANVIVNQESIASFEHEEKRSARKYAALKALHELKLHEHKSKC